MYYRLQGAVSKAKAKVIQQAAVISEQCIQLRNNGAQTFNHSAANSTSYDLTPVNGPPTDHTCATLFDSSSMASNIGTKNGNSLSLQPPIIGVESETKSKNVKTRVESTSSDSLEISAPPSPGLLDPPASTQHITPPSSGVLDSEGPHQDTTSSTDSPTHRDVQNSSPPSPSFLDSPTHKEGLQQGPHHVVYSHAHNSKSDVVTAGHDQAALRLRANRNPTTSIQDALRIRERGKRGNDGTRAFQNLRGGKNGGSKVRYRSVTSTGVSLAPKEPRDGGGDRFESQSSCDLSPSLLMTKSRSQREAVVEVNSGNDDDDYGDYDGEEEEENPMSCSLFTTGTTTSSSQTPVAKKKGARVDLIAEAMLRRSPNGCDVVPVTPGIKSADSILSNDKWMATDAVLPQNRRDAVPSTGVGVRGASNMKQGDGTLRSGYKRAAYNLRSVEVNPASKKACTGEQRSGQTPATESVNR